MAVAQDKKLKYRPTIGVECHVQLKTKTKLFAAVGNDARQAAPNTLISHICVGMPGALPVLNHGAIVLAARAAYALGTTPQRFSHFDRKHYFYPDLPKGYQITQYSKPIIEGGHVHTVVAGEKKCVGITRAHLEEDAGKTTHPAGVDYSLVDLNRAGTPLLEIVSQPDIHSPAEAKAYARELYLLMKYADVSDVDLYHGNMRFDVNISVSSSDKPGKRTEIKNLNSFRSVEAAASYEIERQIELLEKGDEVIQETRGWDEAKQKTTSQRGKEEAEDYRYMPEPDLPPLELDEAFLKEIEADMPAMPSDIRQKLATLDIGPEVIEDALDRPTIVPTLLELIDEHGSSAARRALFWFLRMPTPDESAHTEMIKLKPSDIAELSDLVDQDRLNSNSANRVFEEMLKSGNPPPAIMEDLGLAQVSDQAEIEEVVTQVLRAHPQAAQDVKDGEIKAIGFLVGQVMKTSQGQANPEIAQRIIKQQLGIENEQH